MSRGGGEEKMAHISSLLLCKLKNVVFVISNKWHILSENFLRSQAPMCNSIFDIFGRF